MKDGIVELELREHTALVRLNRPEAHNAVDAATIDRLEEIQASLEADPDILSVILTAAGDRTFCSGGDLRYFASLTERQEVVEMSERMGGVLERFWTGPWFVIAAVNGRALGGGCEILTACHYRLAVPEATLSFVQAANGITTGWGGGARLLEQLGRGPALELLLSARSVDAVEAARIGLLDRLVPAPGLLPAARELAGAVGRNDPDAVRSFLGIGRAGASRSQLERRAFVDRWESPRFQGTLDKYRTPR